MYGDHSFKVNIYANDNNGNEKQASPSFYRRWNRFSSLQRLIVSVVVFALVILVLVLFPTSQNNLPNLATPNIGNDPPNDEEITLQTLALKIRKRKPPVSPNRQFHFMKVNSTETELPLQFNGPQGPRQRAVVNAFQHAWAAYRKYAWGKDELRPNSRSSSEWFGVGLTLLDSLDTMYIMGLKTEFQEAQSWVAQNELITSKDVNLFEFTIRVVGGLLGAYHLTKDDMFLNKALILGEKLLPAFQTPSEIPFSDVNIKTGKAHGPSWGSESSLSEVTTIQLEFNDLSYCSKDSKYRDKAYLVSKKVHDLPKQHEALVPMYISPRNGQFRRSGMLTLGARVDSYYEYLLKQWIQTGKQDDMLKDDYVAAIDAIEKTLIRESLPNKLTFVGEVDMSSDKFYAKMDHLVCFLPGTLALGYAHGLPKSHLLLARKLIFTCYQTYVRTATGLAPEISHFNVIPGIKEDIYIKPADTHNLLRPETVESLFYMYSITGEKQYQEWGWTIFNSFERYTKLEEGYSSINNVKNPHNVDSRNKMESFFLGETLKYFYLLFQEPTNGSNTIWPELDKWIFNTEAHLVPVRSSMNVR